MKLSVSLPADDVEFVDEYAVLHGMPTRSSVLQRAVDLLRAGGLGAAYADAWAAWDGEDGEAWDLTAADGLSPS